MIPKDEMQEMHETLSEVAKMKMQFDLLRQVIKNHLELNYSGDGFKINDDRLIIEVMELIEPAEMNALFACLKQEKADSDADAGAIGYIAMTK